MRTGLGVAMAVWLAAGCGAGVSAHRLPSPPRARTVATIAPTETTEVADPSAAAMCPPEATCFSPRPGRMVIVTTRISPIWIAFAPDRTVLDAATAATVAEIAATLAATDTIRRIAVHGHADVSDSLPELASLRRAEAVRHELIRAGIEPSRIVARGFGRSRSSGRTVDLIIAD